MSMVVDLDIGARRAVTHIKRKQVYIVKISTIFLLCIPVFT